MNSWILNNISTREEYEACVVKGLSTLPYNTFKKWFILQNVFIITRRRQWCFSPIQAVCARTTHLIKFKVLALMDDLSFRALPLFIHSGFLSSFFGSLLPTFLSSAHSPSVGFLKTLRSQRDRRWGTRINLRHIETWQLQKVNNGVGCWQSSQKWLKENGEIMICAALFDHLEMKTFCFDTINRPYN